MASGSRANSRKEATARPALISSRDNQWLKRFRTCLTGDSADDGLVGVEGVRLVEAALGSGLSVEALLISESGERHMARLGSTLAPTIKILRTTDRLFSGIADTQTPQGVAALVRTKVSPFAEIVRGTALVVVLVGVQDPGNVGTILRSAEVFGATGAVTCPAGGAGTANPLAPKALRASAGAALRLPILRGMSPAILFAQLRVSRVKVYAAVPDISAYEKPRPAAARAILRPWEADWKSPAALLIGNEGAGLPEEIIRAADALVSIPQIGPAMPFGAESLNAAMAATVLLYEAMRQRDAQT